MSRPTLRITPYAWAKLLHMRDAGQTEVTGFALTDPKDPLLVINLCLVKQTCTAASVDLDQQSVANYFEDQAVAGRKPAEYGRIWWHTHPGSSPRPSSVDEDTFNAVFSRCDFAVMFIVARGGETYARLYLRQPFPIQIEIDVQIDWRLPFAASDQALWSLEYRENVTAHTFAQAGQFGHWWDGPDHDLAGYGGRLSANAHIPDYTQMDARELARHYAIAFEIDDDEATTEIDAVAESKGDEFATQFYAELASMAQTAQ